ncbi:hypothetical protein KC19_VG148100 [Ceratodon purpureus]|uniref:Uncharacterized protein n=1 Tax=Ceratodon purpureus TaxID=3225 RepID=A0A8T0HRA6_CERPU|nr:hypothetical protein KC19_VG148100 [Ceratodon purpureus]
MASWEMAVCDGPLSELLRQLTVRPDPAAEFWLGPGAQPRRTAYVIQDLENARLASPLWRDSIDNSPEWAMIRLARWDHSNEVGHVWLPYDDYVMNHFYLSWNVFSTSWTMGTPIACPRLCKDPIGWLTEYELDALSTLLWDPTNIRIDVEVGEVLRHAPAIWVSHLHRT